MLTRDRIVAGMCCAGCIKELAAPWAPGPAYCTSCQGHRTCGAKIARNRPHRCGDCGSRHRGAAGLAEHRRHAHPEARP